MAFSVTPAVLIPRPETEHLVEATLKALPENGVARILEPGTGSGAVSIALAKERSNLRCFSSDRGAEALEVARTNARRHAVADRIDCFLGDWLAPVSASASLDAVVCNPPYIPGAAIEELQPEVARFEPRHALDGGADGLDAARRLVPGALRCLRPGGMLLFEIGYDQAAAACRIVQEASGFAAPEVIKDFAGKDRVVRARKRPN